MANQTSQGADDHDSASATVEKAGGATVLRLAGRFDANTLPAIWSRAVAPAAEPGSAPLHVDAAAMTYCDGAGIGLLVELARRAKSAGRSIEFAGLEPDLKSLLDRATPPDAAATVAPVPGAVTQVGLATLATLDGIRDMVAFLGDLACDFAWAIVHPHRVRWADALLVAEKAGVNALPVVCLLGWLIGLIIAFQTAGPLETYGAQGMIPTMLAIAMVRELGPLFTAIILAGRSGSAFAAEIGTMKVTEEINALTTFGLDPVRFLALPKLIATILMTPLLTIFAILFGLLGGYVVMVGLGYTLSFYVNQVIEAVNYVDLLSGLFKSMVFAFLVTAIGCVKGLATQQGPGAVGDSTTRAVVAGIVLIVIADGILGTVFYYTGI